MPIDLQRDHIDGEFRAGRGLGHAHDALILELPHRAAIPADHETRIMVFAAAVGAGDEGAQRLYPMDEALAFQFLQGTIDLGRSPNRARSGPLQNVVCRKRSLRTAQRGQDSAIIVA